MDDPIDFFDPDGCASIPYADLAVGFGKSLPSPVPGKSVGTLYHEIRHPGEALHDLLDPILGLPDAAAAAGDAQGRHDSGKISGGQLAVAYTIYGAKLANAALLIYGAAKMALPCGKGGIRCFVAGTPVQVAWQDKAGQWHVGSKPIEQVKVGEYVVTRNETNGKNNYKRVLRTTIKHTEVVVSVTLVDAKTGQTVETITASREHPFFVEGKGFVPAGGLAIGNSIVTRAGPALIVNNVEWKRQPEGYYVYNFVVDDDHTYFVGNANGGVWVHNPTIYTYDKTPITADQALDRAIQHAGNDASMTTTNGGNMQLEGQPYTNAQGQVVKNVARLDVNPTSNHVIKSKMGPHLNLEEHIPDKNGWAIKTNDHIPIIPSTITPGHYP